MMKIMVMVMMMMMMMMMIMIKIEKNCEINAIHHTGYNVAIFVYFYKINY
jgi:hypothetical protein